MTNKVEDVVAFTSVKFENFKAFADYRVNLKHMNVLVGPNNSGKSTIVGAFRALAAGLRSARAHSPVRHDVDGRLQLAWRLPESVLPISIENVHTNYADLEARIEFSLEQQPARTDLSFGGPRMFPGVSSGRQNRANPGGLQAGLSR